MFPNLYLPTSNKTSVFRKGQLDLKANAFKLLVLSLMFLEYLAFFVKESLQ